MRQQLTPQDAVFLSIESDSLPAHIGGLAFLEPTEGRHFDFDHFVENARDRILACERFSWRLQEVPYGLDRPYWVKVDDFDPAEHIDHVAIPAPGGDEQLASVVGMLFERPLDRSRPLWDMTLIEGLSGGRYVLLWRVHHCMMDGASGANLSERLFDITPDAEQRAPVEIEDEAQAGDPISPTSMWTRAMRNLTGIQRKQSSLVQDALKKLAVDGTRTLADSVEKAAGPSRPEASSDAAPEPPSMLAPRTFFNGEVGPQRGISWSSISLSEVKRIKNAMSVTVNDVVLSITAGAMRGYLEERDALPEDSLIASVPCSTRKTGDASMGNQVTEMPIRWSTDLADPIERLLQVHEDASRAKAAAKDGGRFDMIGTLGEALLPGALSLFMRGAAAAATKIPLPANAVVSNVPMTPFPLYCAGARIAKAVPISLLAPTQGLNITVLSYCDELHFGIVHDPRLVPEPWELSERIAKQLQVLQAAVDVKLQADPGAAD